MSARKAEIPLEGQGLSSTQITEGRRKMAVSKPEAWLQVWGTGSGAGLGDGRSKVQAGLRGHESTQG